MSIFKRCFEYKLLYILGNVRLNIMMVVLWDLIKTILYKSLNIIIHHKSAGLFALHMNSKFQIINYTVASSNNSDFDSENILHQ
jgi:hypothetical protein